MPKKVVIGTVMSDRTAKTRRVEVSRRIKHPKYKKFLSRRTVCHVHDPEEESHVGDTVEIRECQPRSALKRWELVRVVRKSELVDVVALRAQARAEARAAASERKTGKDRREAPAPSATQAAESRAPESQANEDGATEENS